MNTEQMREALRKVRPYLEDGANHGDDAVELLKLVDEAPTAPAEEVPEAMKVVTSALLNDPDYAWAWHCNIAMAAHDGGLSHYAANKAAARFLSMLAPGLDTSKHPGFPAEPELLEQSTRLRGGVPEGWREPIASLLTHIEDVVSEADWERIDPKKWNAVSEMLAAAPQAPAQHFSDCSSNNRGVPELLGPCDCAQAPAAALDAGVVRDADVRACRRIAALSHHAQPAEGGEAAKAWDEGYRQGVEDERTSEANIGIAGFDAKVEPARQNPYRPTPPASQEQAQQPSAQAWANETGLRQIECPSCGDLVVAYDPQQPSGGEVKAAPVESYPAQDQAFYAFWYSHMKGDLMQPPLADISHSTARYIWDSALATPKPEPMTDEQIANVVLQTVYAGDDSTPHRNAWAREIGIPFARAIEAHHGITKGSESAACSVCEGKGHVYRDGRCVGFCRCPAGRNALALNIPPAPITKEQA